MARRKVTESMKGRGGRITGLCGPSFGFRSAEDVIADILGGFHEYYVREGPYESKVRVISEGEEQRLVSTQDLLSPNNLENLPPLRKARRR
jgi:hypothetical protein